MHTRQFILFIFGHIPTNVMCAHTCVPVPVSHGTSIHTCTTIFIQKYGLGLHPVPVCSTLCVFHTLLSLGNNYNGRYINGYLGRTGYTTTFLLCLTLHVSLPLPENHGSLPMMFFYIMCECPINVDVSTLMYTLMSAMEPPSSCLRF